MTKTNAEQLSRLRDDLAYYHSLAIRADNAAARARYESLANDASREVVLFMTKVSG